MLHRIHYHPLKKIVLCVALLALSSCHAPSSLKPGAWVFDQMPKEAPPEFKQAWIDGCKTGLSSMTNSFYKTFYQFTQDPVLRRDPLYYKVWKDTFTFCRHYIYGTLRQGNVRMTLPTAPNYFMDNLAGGDSIFTIGPLQNLGPGTWGLLLENWGETAGQPFFESMGGELDFTDDMIWNGKGASVLEWDFRPTHSIVPY